MNYDIVICEVMYQVVDKVPPLETYHLDWKIVPTPNIFVDEFCCRCGRVVFECPCFYPLGAIIDCGNNVMISSLFHNQFEWAHKIEYF